MTHSASRLASDIRAAQILLPCPDFSAELDFFVNRLGFRVDLIFPADSPSTAVISGHGVSLRLAGAATSAWTDTVATAAATKTDPDKRPTLTLRLLCEHPPESAHLTSPCGVQIEFSPINPPLVVPEGSNDFILIKNNADHPWHVGRAGLEYRDLIPGRLNGRFIASQIRVPVGGPVADYVHFHKVRFQMIFCKTGWVKVVYEDQGEPFVMHAGDCVLQPPEIRHRVLEASSGMEVIEVGCPAIHETIADHKLLLPTGQTLPTRLYGPTPGAQRFVRHIASQATWHPWRLDGFSARDIGIKAATDGVAGAQVVRLDAAASNNKHTARHDGEFLFWFILAGSMQLSSPQLGQIEMACGDNAVLPSGTDFSLQGSSDLEWLEVCLPG